MASSKKILKIYDRIRGHYQDADLAGNKVAKSHYDSVLKLMEIKFPELLRGKRINKNPVKRVYELVSKNGYVQFTGTKKQCEDYRKNMPQPGFFKVINKNPSKRATREAVLNTSEAMEHLKVVKKSLGKNPIKFIKYKDLELPAREAINKGEGIHGDYVIHKFPDSENFILKYLFDKKQNEYIILMDKKRGKNPVPESARSRPETEYGRFPSEAEAFHYIRLQPRTLAKNMRVEKGFHGWYLVVDKKHPYAISTKKERGINPVPESTRSRLEKGTRLYENFRDQDSKTVTEYGINPNRYPKNKSSGKMIAIEYTTVRAGKTEKYRHDFKRFASPFIHSLSKTEGHIRTVGGNFEFTERGFVDKVGAKNTRRPDYSVLTEVGKLDAFEFIAPDGKAYRTKLTGKNRHTLAVTASGDAIFTLKK